MGINPCYSSSEHFQPREDPSRGFLRDCENFADGSFAALQAAEQSCAGRRNVCLHMKQKL